MMKALKKVNWKKLGIFAGGVLFGTAGIKVLFAKKIGIIIIKKQRNQATKQKRNRWRILFRKIVVIYMQAQRISMRQERRRQQRLILRMLRALRLQRKRLAQRSNPGKPIAKTQ